MAGGGKREGAGRPKLPAILTPLRGEILPARMDSVDFLLDVVNDPSIPVELRIKAAIAVAPYQRAKVVGEEAKGKKQRLADAAGEPAEDKGVWGHLG